jgi:hypothetical protein
MYFIDEVSKLEDMMDGHTNSHRSQNRQCQANKSVKLLAGFRQNGY